jgi:hypothetical protein
LIERLVQLFTAQIPRRHFNRAEDHNTHRIADALHASAEWLAPEFCVRDVEDVMSDQGQPDPATDDGGSGWGRRFGEANEPILRLDSTSTMVTGMPPSSPKTQT